MDVAGGLYFAQARRYDATAGRFVSEDKIKGFADAPFTLNPYSYCWNKPMELVDLNGLAPTAGVTAEMGEQMDTNTSSSYVSNILEEALDGQKEADENQTARLEILGDGIIAMGEPVKENVTSTTSTIGNVLDGSYAVIEHSVYKNTNMPSFKSYKNANGTKMISISNSANYNGGRGGIRAISEEKLLVIIGAIVGSVVPGPGTIAGAIIGFVVGVIATIFADSIVHAKFFENNTKSIMDYAKETVNNVREEIVEWMQYLGEYKLDVGCEME